MSASDAPSRLERCKALTDAEPIDPRELTHRERVDWVLSDPSGYADAARFHARRRLEERHV